MCRSTCYKFIITCTLASFVELGFVLGFVLKTSLMKEFPFDHFVFLLFQHHFLTLRTSIAIPALFTQYIIIKFISMIYSSTVGLFANLGENSYSIKVTEFQ